MFNDNSGISAFQERTREALAEEEDDGFLETLSETVSDIYDVMNHGIPNNKQVELHHRTRMLCLNT